jgi:hypothetical protein
MTHAGSHLRTNQGAQRYVIVTWQVVGLVPDSGSGERTRNSQTDLAYYHFHTANRSPGVVNATA